MNYLLSKLSYSQNSNPPISKQQTPPASLSSPTAKTSTETSAQKTDNEPATKNFSSQALSNPKLHSDINNLNSSNKTTEINSSLQSAQATLTPNLLNVPSQSSVTPNLLNTASSSSSDGGHVLLPNSLNQNNLTRSFNARQNPHAFNRFNSMNSAAINGTETESVTPCLRVNAGKSHSFSLMNQNGNLHNKLSDYGDVLANLKNGDCNDTGKFIVLFFYTV